MQQYRYLVLIVLIAVALTSVHGQDTNIADEDLTLTYSEKVTLDKFKARVRSLLPHRYMKEDVYLINWLRAKDFNLDEAERLLKDNLRWRKQNGMDKIHEEDFSDVVSEYPAYVDAVDKNGAPVITASAGSWDLRRSILTGQNPRVHRFLYKIMDEACMKVREAQLDGKNVTRFHFLLNLQGFNLAQHGCPRCVLGMMNFIQSYENHFPGMTDKVVIFNSPPALQVIRPVVREALSRRSRAHTTIFGTTKAEWQNFLLKFIDASELTEDFGGTKISYY